VIALAGWIKLHRKLQENPIYANPFMLKLWVHCLMKASHKEHKQLVGMQVVDLGPGEFVTGRDALAEEFNKGAKPSDRVSALSLWRWLKNLENMEMLNIKSTTKYSVISINNWNEYQELEQQVNNKRTTNEQQMNTNKNEKNDKNEKKDINKRHKFNEKQMQLAELLWKYVQQNDPSAKKPSLAAWANDMRLMMERDNRQGKEIQEVILWATKDDFWHKNILCASKLRKQYDKLKLQMNAERNKVNRGKQYATNQPFFEESESDFNEKRSW
jgi:hypothetical protein